MLRSLNRSPQQPSDSVTLSFGECSLEWRMLTSECWGYTNGRRFSMFLTSVVCSREFPSGTWLRRLISQCTSDTSGLSTITSREVSESWIIIAILKWPIAFRMSFTSSISRELSVLTQYFRFIILNWTHKNCLRSGHDADGTVGHSINGIR